MKNIEKKKQKKTKKNNGANFITVQKNSFRENGGKHFLTFGILGWSRTTKYVVES